MIDLKPVAIEALVDYFRILAEIEASLTDGVE
jgi:hypothetical protein